jgi:hypothetical protein
MSPTVFKPAATKASFAFVGSQTVLIGTSSGSSGDGSIITWLLIFVLEFAVASRCIRCVAMWVRINLNHLKLQIQEVVGRFHRRFSACDDRPGRIKASKPQIEGAFPRLKLGEMCSHRIDRRRSRLPNSSHTRSAHLEASSANASELKRSTQARCDRFAKSRSAVCIGSVAVGAFQRSRNRRMWVVLHLNLLSSMEDINDPPVGI